jgi:acetyl-CoA C-acetyltransferase
MPHVLHPAYMDAVGHTPFGRAEGSFLDLAAAAYDDLTTRHPETPRPDHVLVSTQDPGAFAGIGNVAVAVTDRLGLCGVAASRIEAAPASGLAAFESACALVQSGARANVLILGVETMTSLDTARANQVLARMAHPSERQNGLTMAAMVALMTRAYLERYGHDPALLDAVAARAHAQGTTNRYAQFQAPVSLDDIAASPMVADPLRRHHSAPLSDGAACLMVTAAPGPVLVKGIGPATDPLALTHRPHRDALTHFAATQRAAEEAYGRARIDPSEVDILEVHDAFSPMTAMHLEDLGLFKPGSALPAIAQGKTTPDGPYPTNCGGGLKARGHPVGATGIAMLAELHWQLTQDQEVSKRQATPEDPPRIGLAHNMGGLGNNVIVAILEATS